ncbi:VOC family protein [Actinomycetospora sp. CA-101289]|uniref:VOC family protein n=1 Tax=Actinomycetospora sp. CA-101289 TaxID=3239893 RepID=UPI003D972892
MDISHLLAVVPVSDHEASVRWYENLLGRPADSRPMEALADWHVTETGWLQVFRDPSRAGTTAVNLAVGSIDQAAGTIRARGITPDEPVEASAGVRLLPVRDPDGNVVTLIEGPRRD